MRIISILITILTLMGFGISEDEAVTKVATSAANWLKIDNGVRGISMGGSQVASGRFRSTRVVSRSSSSSRQWRQRRVSQTPVPAFVLVVEEISPVDRGGFALPDATANCPGGLRPPRNPRNAVW